MKYSVRGNISIPDGKEIIDVINKYKLWKLTHTFRYNLITRDESFFFEAWVDSESEKTNLFNDLKPFLANYNGLIDWHKCYHDEQHNTPCEIAEIYRGV